MFGQDVSARARGGADAGHAHGHDLFFQPHLHAVKGRRVRPRLFVHQRGKSRVGAQIGKHGAHIVGRAGNGAVDALARQQDHAFDLALQTQRQQGRAALGVVRQVHKKIEGSSQVARGGQGRGHRGREM